jgi:hypothetical protein
LRWDGFYLAHGRQQSFLAFLEGRFAIGLQQFADVPDKVRIREYFRPVSSCGRRAHAPFLEK